MPKYIIIALAIPILVFFIMHYWSKTTDKTKNRIITSIFGLIGIGFILIIGLLFF